MQRTPHRLRHNASSALPTRLLFFDAETTNAAGAIGPGEQLLRLGSATFWQRPGNKQPERLEHWRFDTAAGFWSRLDRYAVAGKRLVAFAHSAQFDLQALGGLEAMRAAGWVPSHRPVLDKARVIVRARRGRASLMILDSYNFLRGTLEQLGADLGYPKFAMPAADADLVSWQVYNDNDVEVLRRVVGAYLDLVADLDLGYFGMTLPAQALHGYRHRFMDYPIFCHTDPTAIALERAASHGARSEAWRIGQVNEYRADLDINSCYAAVMGSRDYPTALRYTFRGGDPRTLLKRLEDALVIAEVRIVTETPLYPCRLPSGRLSFPVGEFWTTLATPELVLALGRGEVAAVGRGAVYAKAPIFDRWVRELWTARAARQARGDKLGERIVKDLLNTLYGKFGERLVSWSKVGDEPELQDEVLEVRDVDTGRDTTYRRLGGVLEVREQEAEGYNSFPAISAHVTSAARLRLWDLAERAGLEHVDYLDTDGLLVDAVGLERLAADIDPTRLGALKLVRESDDVEIDGPKQIRFGELRLAKGRKRNALDNANGTYTQDEFLGIVAALRAGHHGGPLIRSVTKRDAVPALLGTVGPTGRISPLRLTD